MLCSSSGHCKECWGCCWVLKLRKAHTAEAFMSDHLINGVNALNPHLSFLFNCILSHLHVPKALLIAVLVQYGSKKKHLTTQCSFVSNESVQCYNDNGSIWDRITKILTLLYSKQCMNVHCFCGWTGKKWHFDTLVCTCQKLKSWWQLSKIIRSLVKENYITN